MILLARLLVRILSVLLLVLLAIVGLAAAVFSIQGDSQTLSLPYLADLLHLGDLRDTMRTWFTDLEDTGPINSASALAGVAAVVLGVLLLVGVLVPRRERLVALESGEEGTVTARRRALAQAATVLSEQARGVTSAKVKARPRRRGGGRLKVTVEHTRQADPAAVETAVKERLEPLTGPFALTPRVETRLGGTGSRAQ